MDVIDERLHDKIDSHETQLVELKTIVKSFADNQQRLADSVERMAESQVRQEVLLEKMTNLEVNTKNSIDRLHRRADDNETAISFKADLETIINMKNDLKTLEPVTIMVKYPKLLIFTLIGFYVFSIKEFRDAIFGGIG